MTNPSAYASGRFIILDPKSVKTSQRLLSCLVPLALAACALLLRTPSPATGDGVLTVTAADGLELLAAPSVGAGALAVVPYGTVLSLDGAPTPDGWYPVAYGSLPGWADGASVTQGLTAPIAAADSVLVPPPQPVTPDASSASTAAAFGGTSSLLMVFSPEGLRLRSAPDPNAPVLTTLPDNELVQASGTASNGWYPVSFNGLSGWSSATYLDAPNPAALAAGAALPAGTSLSSTPYGPALLGLPAPFDAGGPTTAAPPDAAGRFIWPVAARMVTTTFKSVHQAIDIGQAPAGGNPVSAVADGVVTYAGGDACCRYGYYVIVQHAGGYSSLVAHLSRIDVSVGQVVHQGQQLGLSGDTGYSTGPHVHFAIFCQGVPLDPLTVLPAGAQIQPGA